MTWGGGAHQNSAVIAGFFRFDGNLASAFLPAAFPPLIVVGVCVVAVAVVVLAVCGRLARRRRDRQLDSIFRPYDRCSAISELATRPYDHDRDYLTSFVEHDPGSAA